METIKCDRLDCDNEVETGPDVYRLYAHLGGKIVNKPLRIDLCIECSRIFNQFLMNADTWSSDKRLKEYLDRKKED